MTVGAQLILGISCSLGDGAVVLIEGSRILEAGPIGPKGVHNRVALQMATDSLNRHGYSLKDVDVFAADVGPGSFTGIRIALSICRALCWSLSKVAVPVHSLDVLALAARRIIPDLAEPFAIGLDARKDFIYLSVHSNDARSSGHAGAPTLAEYGQLPDLIPPGASLVGAGFARMSGSGHRVFPSDPLYEPRDFAQAVLDAKEEGRTTDWKGLVPLYLRRADAEDVIEKKEMQGDAR